MSHDVVNEAESGLQRAYAAAGGKKAFPWATILQAIMALFGGCTAKRAQRFAKIFPEAFKAMVVDKLKEDELASASEAKLIAEVARAMFIKSKAGDIEVVAQHFNVS